MYYHERDENMPGANKQNEILTTAKSLFFKYGVKRVTVEEICRTAGVSKVTYYKYFSNKAALVRIIGEYLVDTGFRQFDEINELDIPYLEKIQQMTEWKMKFFSQMKTEFIGEIISLNEISEKVKKLFLRNITRAQENGEIRGDISPALIWLVTEKMNELIQDGSWSTVFEDYKTFQKQMRTLFFFGMLTRPEETDGKVQAAEEVN